MGSNGQRYLANNKGGGSITRLGPIIRVAIAGGEKKWRLMKGSITFKFGGDPDDYRVRITQEGELDSGDLQVIATLLAEDIKLTNWIASDEIKPTSSDPTGIGQLHGHCSN